MSTNINSTEQIVEINAGDQITNVNIVSQSTTQVISGEQVVTVDVNAGTIPAAWGSITGTLSNQTDLQNALNAKQNNITLTTTGTSGAATLVGSTLNIPNYTDTGLTSVGLAMPEAFTVSGSPLTSNGTISVLGAGTGAQYIKGDGTLATFPTTINQSLTLIREVYNSTGETLTKGTIVYINGGQGNLPTVTKALATGDATSAQTFGVVQANITNQNNGYVVVAGGIDNLDTQAYSVGAALYLSPTTAGAWTTTKPYAPQHLVYIGTVVRSHPTQGVVEVRIANGYELDELHNVSARYPNNNDGLFYNSISGVWENKTVSGALGYTPVPQSRIITINGTAQDLSADRTYNVGTVTSIAASGGTGISVAGSPVTGSGTITITNTAPDQVVGLTGAGTTSISGTYPNFTITSNDQYTGTVTSVAASGGTGISISGSPITSSGTINITNTAPDQIVSLTGAGTTSISGTYPNFTVTSNDQYVGTVTSVNATVPTGFEVSGVPITSSGTVDIKFASGYSLPTNAKQSEWDTAYTKRLDSLTVTGNSGSASLTSNVLNVPTYTLTGLGGEPAITAGTTSQYWRGDKSFQTLDTSVVPENGNVYFTEPRVRATVLSGLNITGGSISASDSVLNAFGKVQNQINGLIGGSIFQSTWNASTNTPTIASGVGTKGYYYIVSVAGTTNLDGITDWQIGDWAIFDGTVWRKVDNTDAVVSVNGFTGVVNLVLDDLADVSAASPTDTQLLRYNGTTSKWYNWTPNYEPALTKGNLTESTSSVLTITGGSNAVIGSGTTIQVKQSSASASGYLSSTDWTTFNNKQSALTNPVTGTGSNNYVPKFTSTGSTIGDSRIKDDGTKVEVLYSVNNSNQGINLVNSNGSGYGNSINFYQSATQTAQIFCESTVADTSEIHFKTLVAGTLGTRFSILSTGAANFSSSITASSIIKSGGTSSQFLKADGTVDSNTYLTTSTAASTYLPLTGGTLTNTGNDNAPILALVASSTDNFQYLFTGLNNSLAAGKNIGYWFGKSLSTKNSAEFVFQWNSNSGNDNFIGIGFYNANHLLKIYPTGAATLTGAFTASISSLGSAATSFVVSDSGTLKSRTAAEVRSDIGAAASSDLSNYLLLTGGTLTGALGGTTASFSTSSNALTYPITIRNTNAGTGANTAYAIGNDSTTNGAGIALFGSQFTNAGQYRANGGYVYSNQSGGLTIHAEGANSMYLATNGVAAITINSSQAVTFSSTISATNFSGSSSGANTGDQTTITGNAGSATILQTARNFTINGTAKSFNGSANVSWTAAEIGLTSYLPLAGGTLTGALTITDSSDVNLRFNKSTATWTNYTNGHGIQMVAANMGAGSYYAALEFGKALSPYNSAHIDYIHVADDSTSNYLALGLYNADQVMNITAESRVGIGLVNPVYKFHVKNQVNGFISRFTGGTSGDVNVGIYTLSGVGASIGTESNHQFAIYTNATDRLTISNSGSAIFSSTVSVNGSTSVDSLTVSRNVADNAGGITLYNANNQGYGSALTFRVNYAGVYNTSRIHGDWFTGNSGALHFFTANTSQALVERMTIDGNGYVGINKNDPAYRLDVKNAANSAIARFTGGTSSNINVGIYATNEFGFASIGTQSNHAFNIYTNDADRLSIDTSGNISLNGGSGSSQQETASPKNIRFNNQYSSGYTDASLKIYLFNSGNTIQGFTSGPAYDLQYHSSGSTSGRHVWYVGNTEVFKVASTSGTVTALGSITASSFFESSDIRLKSNIQDYKSNDILNISAKIYEKDGKVEVGYLAQDLENVLKSAVSIRENGYLDLSYRQVHTAKIAGIENEIKQLKNKLNELGR